MQIVKPSIEVWFHYPQRVTEDGVRVGELYVPESFLERVGRTCYKSEDRITPDSAAAFIKKLNRLGHGAMLEHCIASVKFVCDRGVTHEMVRHRIGASYAQESTRYNNYSNDKFNNQISAIEPPCHTEEGRQIWEETLKVIEDSYHRMIKAGEPPQIARSVLPISVKTEIWATYNLREWQHVFRMRCAKTAHPQIRELMMKVLNVFQHVVPGMFKELAEEFGEADKE